MAPTFHQLHLFYTVAEKSSFSRAAQALHMTQPAVTMQIQGLEDYYGAKLFRRTTKKIELTEAGQALLPYATRFIGLMQEADREMSRFAKKQQGHLQLGASLTIGEYILPRLLGPFAKEFPELTVNMKVTNTTRLLEHVLRQELTFALIEAPVQHPDIHTEPVLDDELLLIVPAGHPLGRQEKVTLSDLRGCPFVLREQGSGTRQVMEEQLRAQGLDPSDLRIDMELGSTGAIKSAVEAGLGVTVLSESSVKHELALGVLAAKRIEGVRFKRSFYVLYLKAALLPLAAVTFLTFIRERDLNRWL
ncbi:LysR family transcriptional regulator [Paenibacillus sp. J31TS4]|uniref:selenium metabolism-associated LysR family transcriptional regulator n=1 Tax=Paenibacillus sp. J31TS4 TaxID=2807195 RepID=UPI001B022DE5|nr:selenium metabolism-associated LysR family transcriptional regulator [Paenibacillus sp. J31TS4]GIP39799.1 LysR family transcriptional regulator [Paenibacillus sp. J31TS4]